MAMYGVAGNESREDRDSGGRGGGGASWINSTEISSNLAKRRVTRSQFCSRPREDTTRVGSTLERRLRSTTKPETLVVTRRDKSTVSVGSRIFQGFPGERARKLQKKEGLSVGLTLGGYWLGGGEHSGIVRPSPVEATLKDRTHSFPSSAFVPYAVQSQLCPLDPPSPLCPFLFQHDGFDRLVIRPLASLLG